MLWFLVFLYFCEKKNITSFGGSLELSITYRKFVFVFNTFVTKSQVFKQKQDNSRGREYLLSTRPKGENSQQRTQELRSTREMDKQVKFLGHVVQDNRMSLGLISKDTAPHKLFG